MSDLEVIRTGLDIIIILGGLIVAPQLYRIKRLENKIEQLSSEITIHTEKIAHIEGWINGGSVAEKGRWEKGET